MKRNYKCRDGESLVEMFKYRKTFVFNFHYPRQVNYDNNRLHSPISLERIWDTKFWIDCKFAWYLYMKEVNTSRATRHFQNGFNIMPILDFWRQLEIYCMEILLEHKLVTFVGLYGTLEVLE